MMTFSDKANESRDDDQRDEPSAAKNSSSNGDDASTPAAKTSSWLRNAALFINCFLNVPMWTMMLFTTLYGAMVYAAAQFHPVAATAVLLYIPYILADTAGPAGRRTYVNNDTVRARLLDLPFFRWVAAYFPVTLIKTVELKADTASSPYIFLYHPHGVIGMGVTAALNTNGCNFDQKFPGIQRHGVTLNAAFLCPIFREYLIAIGFLHADKETLTRVLKSKRSIVLVPGGAAESLYAAPGTFRLVTKRRTGFIRLALETGALPVPCVAFGENNAFSVLTFQPGTAAFAVQQRICKFLSFSTPLLKSPFCVRHPIHVVVGAPVVFDTDASVEECHQHYMRAVEKLYNDHKDQYDHSNIPLEWS
jgi:2-acylglycerol O-acyltransferase 2